jgi:FkbM family methyltransferase
MHAPEATNDYIRALSGTDTLIRLAAAQRDVHFLEQVRQFWRTDPQACAGWISMFDPNGLRKLGLDLPPVFTRVQDIFGGHYDVNVNDHIGWHLFLRGYFDVVPTKVLQLLRICGLSGDYIDGGANIGSTSIPAARMGARVFSVEASNSTAAELVKNVSLNPGVHVTTVNAALCSEEQVCEERYSTIYRSVGNFAAGSLHANWNSSGERFTEMCIRTTLDSLVAAYRISQVLLLKLDIEGYEYPALQGFSKTFAKLRPPVLFEWRPDHLMHTLGRVDDLREVFPSGYRFFSVHHTFAERDDPKAVGIHLVETDLSRMAENVLAITEDWIDHPHLQQAMKHFLVF